MDSIEIQYRLKKLNRTQKYLSKIFRTKESHISVAISGINGEPRYEKLRDKIIRHIKLLEAKQ